MTMARPDCVRYTGIYLADMFDDIRDGVALLMLPCLEINFKAENRTPIGHMVSYLDRCPAPWYVMLLPASWH